MKLKVLLVRRKLQLVLLLVWALLALAACDSDTPQPTPTLGGANPTATAIVRPELPPVETRFPESVTTVGPGRVPSPVVTITSVAAGPSPVSCEPTREDGEGPFYVPNAPERTSVGKGHVLLGVVRSSRDCAPIAGARLEFWQVGPDAQYDDAHRATLFSDAEGAYSFESNFPPGYSGRPPHIHVRVTAEGHRLLITQYYPSEGDTEGTFDLVVRP